MHRPPVRWLLAIATALATTAGIVFGFGVPAQAASNVNYVALGDSYSSGVGAGSYISSSGSCKRSTQASGSSSTTPTTNSAARKMMTRNASE